MQPRVESECGRIERALDPSTVPTVIARVLIISDCFIIVRSKADSCAHRAQTSGVLGYPRVDKCVHAFIVIVQINDFVRAAGVPRPPRPPEFLDLNKNFCRCPNVWPTHWLTFTAAQVQYSNAMLIDITSIYEIVSKSILLLKPQVSVTQGCQWWAWLADQ